MLSTWKASLPDGGTGEELLLSFDQGREQRLLVIPPLFDEANKFRRQIVEILRRLDLSGIDGFLPDLPGQNESLEPLEKQSLESWRDAASQAAEAVKATHVLTIRAGALLAPTSLPGWRYVPMDGAKQLRSMLRARTIAAREAGREETIEALQDGARREGITLAGWQLGQEMFSQLEQAAAPDASSQIEIDQPTVGGRGLWLRAEPDEDPEQADAIAAIVAIGMQGA